MVKKLNTVMRPFEGVMESHLCISRFCRGSMSFVLNKTDRKFFVAVNQAGWLKAPQTALVGLY